MSDIKNKIIDILFEKEPDDVVEASLSDIDDIRYKEPKVKKELTQKLPDAKTVLYGKENNHSHFLDLYEVPRKVPKQEGEDVTYEMKENVSPIFGPIAQKERRKKVANDKEIQKAITNNTGSNEYSGIVLSPIYGYDTGKANDARKSLYDKKVKEEEPEEVYYHDDEAPFEIPDDVKETIKEAVQEAVVELTPKEETEYDDTDFEKTSDDVFVEEEEKTESEETVKKESIDNDEVEATRSIYDTTPIQLFNIDELTEDTSKEKDLFDELIGDDD